MNDIHPLKPVIDFPLLTNGEKWALIGFALVLVLGLLTWLYFKYGQKFFIKKEMVQEVEEVKIDYQKEVRAMLIDVRKILDIGDYKRFHLELSKALKWYLGHKHGFLAGDMTSNEILREEKITGVEKEKLNEFFYKNNLAKFASRGLEREVALEVFGKVEEIINTIPA